MSDQEPTEKQRRAEEFKRRVKATGLSQSEFRERSGITRNVYYNLSIGQEPKPDQWRRIEAVFTDPSARVEDANT